MVAVCVGRAGLLLRISTIGRRDSKSAISRIEFRAYWMIIGFAGYSYVVYDRDTPLLL